MATESLKVVYEVLKNEKKNDDTDAIEPKDFFWDQFLKYISSAILALTVLNVSVDFLRDGGIKCFPPPDTAALLRDNPVYEFGRDHASYVNNYCARSVPITEYFPIYILVHGILLVAPHYIWNAVFKGDFDSFFAIAEKFDRLRSCQTGKYQESNFDRVKKLEDEHGGTKRDIFNAYILKLFIQLLTCIGSVIFSALYFNDFSFSFDCPQDFETGNVPHGWPLNVTIPCVYTSLRILRLVRYADFFLNALAGVLALFGLAWCFIRHTRELGHIEIARFSFQACLISESFIFPPMFSWPSYPCFRAVKHKGHGAQWLRKLIWIFTHYPRVHVRNIYSPGVRSDLDFLVMRLFRADSSHGKVFKDIQINKELKSLIGRDHQLLHLYINIQSDMNTLGRVPQPETFMPSIEEEEDSLPDDNGCCGCLRRFFRRRPTATNATNRMFPGVDEPDRHAGDHGNVSSPSSRHPDEGAAGQNGDHTSRAVATALEMVPGGDRDRNRRGHVDIDGEIQPREELQLVRNREQMATRGEVSDFHELFLDAGFTTGNPERLAFHFFKPHLGNLDFHAEDFRGIRDWIYWFVAMFGPKESPSEQHGAASNAQRPSNTLAIDISFGSIGYALVLARPFKRVLSINFDSFFRGRGSGEDFEVVVMDEFYTNYATVKFPHDIFTQQNFNINDVSRRITEFLQKVRGKIDFLVVGPISEEQKRVSVNLMINQLYTLERIRDKALLLAIRPLKVGSTKLSRRYYQYAPSKQLFDDGVQKDEIEQKLKDRGIKLWPVDENKGIQFFCGKVPCVFEFSAYRFNGASIRNNSMRAPREQMNKNRAPRLPPQLSPPNNDASTGLHPVASHGQLPQPLVQDIAHNPQAFATHDQSSFNSQSLYRRRPVAQHSELHNAAVNFAESVDLPFPSRTSSVISSDTQSGTYETSNDEIDGDTVQDEPRMPVQNPMGRRVLEPSNVIRTSLNAAGRVCAAMVAPQSIQAMEDSPGVMHVSPDARASEYATNHNSSSRNSLDTLPSLPQGINTSVSNQGCVLSLDKNARKTSQTTSESMPLRQCLQEPDGARGDVPASQKPWIPMKDHYTDQQKALLSKFPRTLPPKERVRVIEAPVFPNNDHPHHTPPDQPKLDLADPSNNIHRSVSHIPQVPVPIVDYNSPSELEEVFPSAERISQRHRLSNTRVGTGGGSVTRPRIRSEMSLNHDEIFDQVLLREIDSHAATLAVSSQDSGTLAAVGGGAVESLLVDAKPAPNEERELSESEV